MKKSFSKNTSASRNNITDLALLKAPLIVIILYLTYFKILSGNSPSRKFERFVLKPGIYFQKAALDYEPF
jgi:hypothetical protein